MKTLYVPEFTISMSDRKVKLFLSHAWEDKEAIVERLYEALKDKFEIWYDQKSLQLGDSLTFEVNEGLRSCDYGLIVLSETYMRKKWTRDEYTGVVNLATNEKRIILPIWHKVTREQVVNFSPVLADRVAVSSDQGIEVIVAWVEGAIWGSGKARALGDPLQKRFTEVADRLVLRDESLDHVMEGAALLGPKIGSFFNNLNKRFHSITFDLWASRTMNRLSANMMKFSEEGMREDTADDDSHITQLRRPPGPACGPTGQPLWTPGPSWAVPTRCSHVLIGEVIVPPKSEPVRRTWIPTASLVISRGSPHFVRRTRNDFLIVTAAE